MHTRTTDTPTAPEARRRTLPAPAIARSEPVPLPGDKPPGATGALLIPHTTRAEWTTTRSTTASTST